MGKVDFAKSEASHSYGAGALGVEAALRAPKAPATVGNVQKMEQLHQGVKKFSSS